ncbi:NAD-dependent epimerase/dehydratase family protein [Mycobacterium sp. CVI_P3]|uniref:NAD-dependent epimerase/dehydratase family protein n=1 Tax=Mycobacterium pinniadriaticum TaxID=2994102 RepID=A0ABT3SC55_9MYCO|nr:NAD-dependent epimerase/dehydratase family protein [Mycobacterium pinniadriaticum]MCX2930631.1 NAD-dependent epimerase/dehydratase family protein [Mycobacterium pinniadriaticum]MCX2937055.1 NAD-dependent epimerase/dehydratase family protein [Mycobacterium pinniadriaticum]
MSGRVLVTGGTGAAGAATVKWLKRMGADVVVLARRAPSVPLAGVEYVAADIQDSKGVSRAVAGCDAIAHFAWTVSAMQSAEIAEGIDIGGTANLLRAMVDHDCRRMVFASSITVYGGHADHPQPFTEDEAPRPAASFHYERNKVRAEKMIVDSGVQAVNVRPTVIVGRSSWSAPANIFRQPVVVTPGRDARMQLVHVDDVGRFCAQAALGGPTGTVNLNADDALTFTEMAQVVGRPVVNSGKRFSRMLARTIGRAENFSSIPDLIELFLHYPLGDTRKLREDFGFSCAYTSAEAVADMTDWSASMWTVGTRSIRKPVRLAVPAIYPRVTAAADGRSTQIMPPEYTGEFDSRTGDPDLPEWSAANLSEAFPGPMTPLSLGLANKIMFSGANMLDHLFPMDRDLITTVSTKQVGTIGHRLYNNMTVMKMLADVIPGQTPESFELQMNGTPLPEGYRAPRLTGADAVAGIRAALKGGPQIVGLGREVSDMERRVTKLIEDRHDLADLTDEQLHSRIELVTDLVVRSWDINNMNTFMVSLPMNLIRQRYGEKAAMDVRAGTQNLRSAALLNGVRELADMLADDAGLRLLIENSPREVVMDKLRTDAPRFAAKFERLIADCGHRGPGETELSNPVYADAPELLLRSVLGSIRPVAPVPEAPPRSKVARALTRLAVGSMERREHGRDVCMRVTYEMRLVLREWGRRLADRGTLASADDVHYLSIDELYYPPVDSRDLVVRRRAERTRLAELEFPVHFTQPWMPDDGETATANGVVTGQAASPGVARGVVRILSHPDDDFEPGEVLVANVTDTGWTPFFGCAAAIVTNIGGPMSHAAIVAREFGIPAVVNTMTATSRLKNGQLVEVDGSAGTVRVVDEITAP